MRINNPACYSAWAGCWLDGQFVRRCYAADEEAGIVWFYDDPPRLNFAGTRVCTHRARGKVEIAFDDRIGLPEYAPLWVERSDCSYYEPRHLRGWPNYAEATPPEGWRAASQ